MIEPYVNYVEKEKMSINESGEYLETFLKILSAFIEQHLKEVQQLNEFGLYSIYGYAFIWAFVHPIHSKYPSLFLIDFINLIYSIRYEKELQIYVRQLFHSFDLPTINCKLTDFYPDLNGSMNSSRMISIDQWLKMNEMNYDCLTEYKSAMRLMKMLIQSDFPIGIYSFEKGFGKTTLTKELLSNHSSLRLISSNEKCSLLRNELFVDQQSIIHHSQSHREKKFIVWIEDLHQTNWELIRSWIDPSSRIKQEDFNLLFTGQTFHLCSNRLRRHFVPIILHESLSNLIDSIYSISIRDWLEEFSVDAINHPIELSQSTILTLEQIFHFSIERFPQYQWNLHNVQSIVQGMFLLDAKNKRHQINARLSKKKINDEQTTNIVRLLIHEISRVILDRLHNSQGETDLFSSLLFIVNLCCFRSNCF